MVAPKRVFISSVLFGSNLGGLQGADAKCTALAAAAGRGGTWKAWLSTSTTDAINRIADVGPWFLITGEKAFNNKFGLMGAPLVAIVVTEEGTTVGGGRLVWTGTKTGGTAVTSTGTNGLKRFHTCADWTSSDWATAPGGWIGLSSTSSPSGWTDDQSVISGGKLCGTDGTEGARIYCFEQ